MHICLNICLCLWVCVCVYVCVFSYKNVKKYDIHKMNLFPVKYSTHITYFTFLIVNQHQGYVSMQYCIFWIIFSNKN